jgi:hypothetical protein
MRRIPWRNGVARARGWVSGLPREEVRRWLARLAWLLPVGYFVYVLVVVASAPGPRAIDVEERDGVRFGLGEPERRALYSEIARYADHWDRMVRRDFPGHIWSQHDHFSNQLMYHVLMLAGRYELHYSVVFLIYDEGVHAGWTGPRGQTLPATWVPLQPRTQ